MSAAVSLLLLSAALASEAPAPVEPFPVDAKPGDPFLLQAIGAPRLPRLEGDALERRTQEVASLIRCPVCQGSSIAESPSTMAQNMKSETRDMLALGYDQEQVIHYFELAYGEFIRLQPKADGFGALVWLLPALVLVGGAGAVAFAVRRLKAPRGRTPPPALDDAPERTALPEDPELARYVRRVRELVYGWPGGEPQQQKQRRESGS
jgi:cytochrome c-type biogenesis protein CcmH/NrfF